MSWLAWMKRWSSVALNVTARKIANGSKLAAYRDIETEREETHRRISKVCKFDEISVLWMYYEAEMKKKRHSYEIFLFFLFSHHRASTSSEQGHSRPLGAAVVVEHVMLWSQRRAPLVSRQKSSMACRCVRASLKSRHFQIQFRRFVRVVTFKSFWLIVQTDFHREVSVASLKMR